MQQKFLYFMLAVLAVDFLLKSDPPNTKINNNSQPNTSRRDYRQNVEEPQDEGIRVLDGEKELNVEYEGKSSRNKKAKPKMRIDKRINIMIQYCTS